MDCQPRYQRTLRANHTGGSHDRSTRPHADALSALAGYFAFYGVGDNLMRGRGEPERLSGVPVSGNFFEVLGVQPQLGRTFSEEEGKWNGPKAVLLSHRLWQRRFASDPSIVGTALILNEDPHTVVGVMPASFDFASVFAPGSHFDLYFPFPLITGDQPLGQHHGDDRSPETRCLGSASTEPRSARWRPNHQGASRTQLVRGSRQAVGRAGQRPDASRVVGARGRRRRGHVDRLRQSLEPAARQDDCPRRKRWQSAAPSAPDDGG